MDSPFCVLLSIFHNNEVFLRACLGEVKDGTLGKAHTSHVWGLKGPQKHQSWVRKYMGKAFSSHSVNQGLILKHYITYGPLNPSRSEPSAQSWKKTITWAGWMYWSRNRCVETLLRFSQAMACIIGSAQAWGDMAEAVWCSFWYSFLS